MELSITYISSQIIAVIAYIFSGSTYHVKKRRTVLILNFLGQIGFILTYTLLEAWSGVAVSIVAVIRNLIFYITENKDNRKNNKNKDFVILCFIYIISIILATVTYENIYSLLPLIPTLLYTYAVCQKNIKIYKILGIPIQIFWVIYSISVMSIVAIILETTMLINCFIGYCMEVKKQKK